MISPSDLFNKHILPRTPLWAIVQAPGLNNDIAIYAQQVNPVGISLSYHDKFIAQGLIGGEFYADIDLKHLFSERQNAELIADYLITTKDVAVHTNWNDGPLFTDEDFAVLKQNLRIVEHDPEKHACIADWPLYPSRIAMLCPDAFSGKNNRCRLFLYIKNNRLDSSIVPLLSIDRPNQTATVYLYGLEADESQRINKILSESR